MMFTELTIDIFGELGTDFNRGLIDVYFRRARALGQEVSNLLRSIRFTVRIAPAVQ
jgi:hypothetical protein